MGDMSKVQETAFAYSHDLNASILLANRHACLSKAMDALVTGHHSSYGAISAVKQ